MTRLRDLYLRDLTPVEEGVLTRHPCVSIGELCDFCRSAPPVWWWQLHRAAVDTPDGIVITPERMYACPACWDLSLGATTAGELLARGILATLPHDLPGVRLAMAVAFVHRRITGVCRIR